MATFTRTIGVGKPSTELDNDKVPCSSPSGIAVLIVGAGVGGLMAALECHRKGHSVRIFEKSKTASAGGDMFTIGLSARKIMRHYPAMQRELDEISLNTKWMRFRKWTGEDIGKAFPFKSMVKAVRDDEIPMVTQLRPLYHAMLYHQVQRFGIDVTFGKRVVEYYEDVGRGVGGVVTDDSEHAEVDLVIAADGLHSHSQKLGGQTKCKPSGLSLFRAVLPLELALANELVREYFGLYEDKHPVQQAWIGPNTHAVILSYVDKNSENGQVIWALAFRERGEQLTKESWHHTVTSEAVLKVIDETPGWGEPFKALVKITPPNHIIGWPLMHRDPAPRVHAPGCRILQIGDAAHSFLPTSGNGATQAIEDAITIAECLAQAGKDSIPTAVKTHNLLRADRVSCAQYLGVFNAENYYKRDFSEATIDPSAIAPKVPKWVWQLDPEEYARENYAAAAASLEEGRPAFVNTNTPPGYEPTPWSLDSISRSEREGKKLELSGDWS
ncbi:uncharacterized protein BCR38DRAFT_525408 [Pseudomassariella vexata]|uniref:FAD-binding domain-containing protein n=1 Tax=Pseudomassariella vexata TaxID=1141098 RepID=A0A1Y2DT22_9PEZI|nr:uncharacterized protein BCR38DRAFT_525408 [Pseudomassariella vexata]ORY62410.1 hypothetical protein BCR38DRAFT_525408 [Pseudomassariella vexata]